MSDTFARRVLRTCFTVSVSVLNVIVLLGTRLLGSAVIQTVSAADDVYGSRGLLSSFPGIWVFLFFAMVPVVIVVLAEWRVWNPETFLVLMILTTIAALIIAGVIGIVAYRHWAGPKTVLGLLENNRGQTLICGRA